LLGKASRSPGNAGIRGCIPDAAPDDSCSQRGSRDHGLLLGIPRERSWCLPPPGALPNLCQCALPSHFCPLPPRDLRLCGALPPSHTGVRHHLCGTLPLNLRPLILGDHLHGMLPHHAGVHRCLHGTLPLNLHQLVLGVHLLHSSGDHLHGTLLCSLHLLIPGVHLCGMLLHSLHPLIPGDLHHPGIPSNLR
jgi:hypothetical protein